MYSAHEIAFLQRLHRERPQECRAGKTALFFYREFHIGRLAGATIEYDQGHYEAAAQHLVARGLPLEALGKAAQRADAAVYAGLSEKQGTVAPHADSVALKTVGGCTVQGQALWTPDGAYMVSSVADACQVTCDVVCWVENFETFRRLHEYRWIAFESRAVLVLYRGDSRFSPRDALQCLRLRAEPVWAFVDFDPAGLLIANGVASERLERLLHPGSEWLREAAADSSQGRALYAQQVDRCRGVLDGASSDIIREAWALLQGLRSGVTQERMRGA